MTITSTVTTGRPRSAVIAVQILRFAAQEHRRHRAWKGTLPPDKRREVEIAETAAIWGAAYAAHRHMSKKYHENQARLATSAMGQTMPDGVTPRPTDRIAALRQQAAMHCQSQQQPVPAGQVFPDPAAYLQQRRDAMNFSSSDQLMDRMTYGPGGRNG